MALMFRQKGPGQGFWGCVAGPGLIAGRADLVIGTGPQDL
jgi:hypothetical protein